MTNVLNLTGLLAAGFFVVFFFSIIGIALYLLQSYGLYISAQKKGLENDVLAWIPIARSYIFAQLAEPVSLGQMEIPYIAWILPIGAILSYLPVIGGLIAIAYAICYFATLYKFYKDRTDNYMTYFILSFLGVTIPIFIFMLRDK